MSASVRVVLTTAQLDRVVEEDVYPIRPDLLLMARDKWGGDRVVDLSDVATVRERRRHQLRIHEQLRDFTDAFTTCPSPYPNCLDPFLLDAGLRMMSWFVFVLEKLRLRYPQILLSLEDQEPSTWRPNTTHFLFHAAYAGALLVRRTHGGVVIEDAPDTSLGCSWPGRLQRIAWDRMRIMIGCVLNRLPTRWIFGKIADRGAWAGIGTHRILLAGVQITDIAHQPALAVCLGRIAGKDALWLTGEQTKNLEADEAARLDQRDVSGIKMVHETLKLHRRHWFMSVCSGEAVREHAAKRWADLAGWRGGCDLLRYVFRKTCVSDPVASWQATVRMMQKIQPRVIVGHSAIHGMCPIRSWARRHRVPFILLPHGFFHETGQVRRAGLGDVFVQFGPAWREVYQRSRDITKPAWMGSGGKLYLDSATRDGMNDPAPKNSVLVLENCDMANPGWYPHSSREYIDWMIEVGLAARDAGMRLIIRGHPRKPVGDYYDRLIAILGHEGIMCSLDRGDSLQNALRSSMAVVTRLMDTSVAQTIHAGVPVMGFDPVGIWPPSRQLLEHVAGVARSRDKLTCWLKSMSDDGRRQTEKEKQRERLNPWLDVTDDQGHERVAKLACDLAWGKTTVDQVDWIRPLHRVATV